MVKKDEEVELKHNKNRLRMLRKKSPERAEELEAKGTISARIIKMNFPTETGAALITNLPEECRAGEIQRLYRQRWEIEKKYHTLKNKLKFESVSGKASIYVEKDFWAQVLVFNMIRDLIQGSEQKVAEKAKKRQYRYQMRINENIAIGLYKEKFIQLMLEDNGDRRAALFSCLQEDMIRNLVPVRHLPGRPRKWNYFNKYKCNQKPSF